MNSEILGVIVIFLVTVALAIPLGKYIAKVYHGDRVWTDPLFNPIERLFYKISRIDPNREMTWKQHMVALLTINLFWFFWAMFIFMNQGWLPLNPDGNPSMGPDLAFNTAISFLVNCNLQHYSGETGLTYLSQTVGIMFLQFVTAGTGMAAAAVVFNALRERSTEKLGNFYYYFVRSCTRILLPVSFVVALVLVFQGTPMTYKGHGEMVTMQGDSVNVARGPIAAMVAIKQAGTNGGGWFGPNSTHPFENPTYFANIAETSAIFLIPVAMAFALGFYLKRKKLGWMVFGTMTVGVLLLLLPTIAQEMGGNPLIEKMGVSQPLGNMEGKEVRFGPAASGLWEIVTTVTSNGSVNSMHDSSMPLSGMNAMWGMMINAFYGGVGVGFLNFFVFMIIAVFISGLMVGRTPELLGKKVEAKEMKIAMIIALLHPLLILAGTALASYFAAHDANMGWWFANADGVGQKATGWLNNPGYHGFSEMLYEYTSASANNGSGFEGLGDNNPFWNITTGIVLILSRYLPIVGPVAIAGLLARKNYIPESAGTLKTDTGTFGMITFAVIAIVAALAFFPAIALGPIAEWVSSF